MSQIVNFEFIFECWNLGTNNDITSKTHDHYSIKNKLQHFCKFCRKTLSSKTRIREYLHLGTSSEAIISSEYFSKCLASLPVHWGWESQKGNSETLKCPQELLSRCWSISLSGTAWKVKSRCLILHISWDLHPWRALYLKMLVSVSPSLMTFDFPQKGH